MSKKVKNKKDRKLITKIRNPIRKEMASKRYMEKVKPLTKPYSRKERDFCIECGEELIGGKCPECD